MHLATSNKYILKFGAESGLTSSSSELLQPFAAFLGSFHILSEPKVAFGLYGESGDTGVAFHLCSDDRFGEYFKERGSI